MVKNDPEITLIWSRYRVPMLHDARSARKSHENPKSPSPKSKHPWNPTDPLNIGLTTSDVHEMGGLYMV